MADDTNSAAYTEVHHHAVALALLVGEYKAYRIKIGAYTNAEDTDVLQVLAWLKPLIRSPRDYELLPAQAFCRSIRERMSAARLWQRPAHADQLDGEVAAATQSTPRRAGMTRPQTPMPDFTA